MSLIVQDIPFQHRFQPESFEATEKQIIAGALNKYGVENPFGANVNNLGAWTWEQIRAALRVSRTHCIGDSLDDVTDVMYALNDAERAHVH